MGCLRLPKTIRSRSPHLRILLIQDHLGATEQRGGPSAALMRDGGSPLLGGAAQMFRLSASDQNAFVSGAYKIRCELYRGVALSPFRQALPGRKATHAIGQGDQAGGVQRFGAGSQMVLRDRHARLERAFAFIHQGDAHMRDKAASGRPHTQKGRDALERCLALLIGSLRIVRGAPANERAPFFKRLELPVEVHAALVVGQDTAAEIGLARKTHAKARADGEIDAS